MLIPVYLPRTSFWRYSVPQRDIATGDRDLDEAYRKYRLGDQLCSRAYLYRALTRLESQTFQEMLLRGASLDCLLDMGAIPETSIISTSPSPPLDEQAVLQSAAFAFGQTIPLKGHPLENILLSARWKNRVGEQVDASLAPWITLFDASQWYHYGNHGVAAGLWARLTTNEGFDPLLRALAQLGLAQVAAEIRVENDVVNATGRAYSAFKQTGNLDGCAQAQLLAAEFAYCSGKTVLAEAELEGANTIFGDLQNPAGQAEVNIIGGLGSSLAGNDDLAKEALRVTGDMLLAHIPRVPADQVRELADFSVRMPSLRGREDPRPLELKLSDARELHRWASRTRDPLLQLISLPALAQFLQQGSCWSDAAFYEALAQDIEARYNSAVPLRQRLLRAAFLDYDFLSQRELGTEPTLNFDFSRQVEALLANQTMLRREGLKRYPKVDLEEAERAFQVFANALRGIATKGDTLRLAIHDQLAANDKGGVARSTAEMLFQANLLFGFLNEFNRTTKFINKSFTVNQNAKQAGKTPYRVHTEVAADFILSRPGRNKLEVLHHEKYLELVRDVWGGVIVRNEKYVQRGVGVLVDFYELYREIVKPPSFLNLPFTFLGRDGLGALPPSLEQIRDQQMDLALGGYAKGQIGQVIRDAVKEDLDSPDELGRIEEDKKETAARSFLEANFEIDNAKSSVGHHQVTRSELDGEKVVNIQHSYTIAFNTRADSEYSVLPPGASGIGLERCAQAIRRFGENPPFPLNGPRFDTVLQSFHLSKMIEGTLSVYGVDVDPWLQGSAAFHSILDIGQQVLSAHGTDDFVARSALRFFADWKQLFRSDENARDWALTFAQIVTTADSDAKRQAQSQIRNLFDSMDRMGAAHSGRSFPQNPAQAVMNWTSAMQMLSCPPILLLLLDDTRAAESAAQQLATAVREDTAIDQRGVAARRVQNRLSLSWYYMAVAAYDQAIEQLATISREVREPDLAQAFQVDYLQAMCCRRTHNPNSEVAHLRLATEDLDRFRRTLRTRHQALVLHEVRRLIYEEYLGCLFALKRYGEMAAALHNYKLSTQIPASVLQQEESSESELKNLIRETTFLYDVLSREEVWKVQNPVWHAALGLTGLDRGTPVDPAKVVSSGLHHIANVLVDQVRYSLPQGVTDQEAWPEIPEGSLFVSYFVGKNGLYRVSMNSAGNTIARYIALADRKLSETCARFRTSIEERTEPSPELWDLMLGELPDSAQISNLYISPDASLNFIPFEALRSGPEASYLVENCTLTYLTGAIAPTRNAGAHDRQQILVVGNPDGTLPAAEDEARAISRLQTYKHRTALLRSQATLANLRSRLAGANLVHFATHALSNQSHPNFAYLQLAGWDRLYSIDLGGLSFSGKDVFLSACETRLGEVIPGEDVYGMADTFLAAGASSVICTQWRVEDESTALFSERYYQILAQAQNPPEALAVTQREFIQGKWSIEHDGQKTTLKPPFYWAGFNHLAAGSVLGPIHGT
jgi:CHAT domain-containing protein